MENISVDLQKMKSDCTNELLDIYHKNTLSEKDTVIENFNKFWETIPVDIASNSDEIIKLGILESFRIFCISFK